MGWGKYFMSILFRIHFAPSNPHVYVSLIFLLLMLNLTLSTDIFYHEAIWS